MSGGHFEYRQYPIRDIFEEIEELIQNNDSDALDAFGYEVGRHYTPAVVVRLREAVRTLKRGLAMVNRVDWLVSGDDGEETFLERWDQEMELLEKEAHQGV